MDRILKYININYTDLDVSYIDELCTFLNNTTQEIIDFFNIDNINVDVTIYNLEDFRSKYKEIKNKEPKEWLCGLSYNMNQIAILSLSDYNKTESHKNDTLEDIKYLILHEFTHACHKKVNPNLKELWFVEALATSVSHQYDNYPLTLDVTLEQVINGTSYKNYHTLYVYIKETYGKDYIMKLINDNDLVIKQTEKIYEEARNWIKENNNGSRTRNLN